MPSRVSSVSSVPAAPLAVLYKGGIIMRSAVWLRLIPDVPVPVAVVTDISMSWDRQQGTWNARVHCVHRIRVKVLVYYG